MPFGGLARGGRITTRAPSSRESGRGAYSQRATPPWCEQVPWRCWLKLYDPSTHWAVAPGGAEAAWVGRGTQFPSLLM